MNKIIFAFGFVLGAGCGAVATWGLMKKKNEEKLNAQIQACLRQLTANSEEPKKAEEEPKKEDDEEGDIPPKPQKTKKKPTADLEYYTDYQAYYEGTKPKKSVPVRDDREVIVDITENEYNDPDNTNEQESITRYMDGVFADESFRQITDPVGVFGQGVVDYFNEGDTDTLWIRNLTRNRDYEICYEERTYEDAYPRQWPN